MDNKEVKTLYRGDHGWDENLNTKIEFLEFKVIKTTPKGWRILDYNEKDRWISFTSIKKYAYPTKEQALIGYYRCREYELNHLIGRISYVKDMKKIAKKQLTESGIEIKDNINMYMDNISKSL